MQRNRRRTIPTLDIPVKANRILNFILLGIVLILIRVWHLGVIQHEQRVEEARKPQVRVVIEPAKRGTIRDRYNIPLAINKVQYNAAILYSQIRQIPSVAWEKKDGKKTRVYKRREHISNLSQILGKELGLDPDRIEDLIHSKASFYNSIPFILKEDISEKEYYRLKMLEKDMLGVHMQILPKRYYPRGPVAGDILGYMGAISRDEYETVIGEIKTLESLLADLESGAEVDWPKEIKTEAEARKRLDDLIEHAYTINDYLGKTGVEGGYEGDLRGFHGKKSYFSDARGNYLKELPGSRSPVSGRRVLLSISAELQEFSEMLLAQNEDIRTPRLSRVTAKVRQKLQDKEPWIKGGAIVAMDPQTGEILAMASHPRFDPNDFITSGNLELKKKRNNNIHRWFESEKYMGDIWDQMVPLERELFDPNEDDFYSDSIYLTWEKYLKFILPIDSPVKVQLDRVGNLKTSVEFQRAIDRLMELTEQDNLYAIFNVLYTGPQHTPHGKKIINKDREDFEQKLSKLGPELDKIRKTIDPILNAIPKNYDKVLFADLCRVAVDEYLFTQELLKKAGTQTLSTYHDASSAFRAIEEVSKTMSKELFHELAFKIWREQNQKPYLKEMRIKEKVSGKRFASPYIDLLDAKERELFQKFWDIYRTEIILAFLTGEKNDKYPFLRPYYDHFMSWHHELKRGAHKALSWHDSFVKLQVLFKDWDSSIVQEYLKTLRHFEQLDRPLLGKYPRIRKEGDIQLEKHLASAFYPQFGFGYGRSYAFRQASTQGSVFKLVTSYAALMQRYYELESKKVTETALNPLEMYDDYFKTGNKIFIGYDSTKKPIPQLYKGGLLPKSSRAGIGKLDILKAIEVSSNPYFSLLAGDFLYSPNDLLDAAKLFSFGERTGIDLPYEFPGRLPKDLLVNRNGVYAMAIGQHSLVVTPLQTAVMLSAIANGGKILKPKVVKYIAGETPKRSEVQFGEMVTSVPTMYHREIVLPKEVRHIILSGMRRVVESIHKQNLGLLSFMYKDYPGAISDYLEIKDDMVGKSGTAESMEFTDLDSEFGTNMYNHIWFGGIAFNQDADSQRFMFKDEFGVPEIVVVVYLRAGNWGRDAVPVAAQVAQKWREIKKNSIFKESL